VIRFIAVILTHLVALKEAPKYDHALCMDYKTCETLPLGWCVEHTRVLRSTTKCDPIHSSDPYTFGRT
jgi:hypothetical protein